MSKKRHHYIPKAYLKYFCDQAGMVRVYMKDDPTKVIRQSPDSTGFHKYFYSQPLPEGGKDDDSLENVFSDFEGKWPPIVERLQRKEDVNDSLADIFTFIALQRVRVPASRDATEALDAENVKTLLRSLDASGKLPPKPAGFENIVDRVQVTIDPHRSIHAMLAGLQGAGQVLDRIGLSLLHNTTDIPFLTSDNPVIWFDPSVPETAMRPYALRPDGPVALLFPVTPRVIFYGDTTMQPRFSREGLAKGDLTKVASVKTMNRHLCRFAYRTVFAQAEGQERLIEKYAGLSPVVETVRIPQDEGGEVVLHQMVFGRRVRKPKWDGPEET